jgi:hypothetical protein
MTLGTVLDPAVTYAWTIVYFVNGSPFSEWGTFCPPRPCTVGEVMETVHNDVAARRNAPAASLPVKSFALVRK